MITIKDVLAAGERLKSVANPTPVLTSRTLDSRVGARLFFKAENFQRSGSFKFRGAYNKTASLSPNDIARGVITLSSGNHAQAVSLAARLCQTHAIILMPEDVPTSKLEATRAYGAEVITFDRYREDFEELLNREAGERGLPVVHSFDDWLVIAGQGTAALELIEDVGELDVLLVCVGGGGLIAGSAIAAKALQPTLRIIGVEPATGDDTRRSLEAGKRIQIDVPRTIADGLQLPVPGELTFEVIRRLVENVVTVSDEEIVDAMTIFFERMKVVVEPSAATVLAAVLAGKLQVCGNRVGMIISGGNVSPSRFRELVGERHSQVGGDEAAQRHGGLHASTRRPRGRKVT
jgi:threonine dehydratase